MLTPPCLHACSTDDRHRLVVDFFESDTCEELSLEVEQRNYIKAKTKHTDWLPISECWELLTDNLLELTAVKIDGSHWCVPWRHLAISHKQLADDVQDMFDGAASMFVIWLTAVKEEAAIEGAAAEKSLLAKLNKRVSESIDLSGDGPGVDWSQPEEWRPRPGNHHRNHHPNPTPPHPIPLG